MSVHLARKRAKRLLRRVKKLQAEDLPLTPYLLLEAKYRFLLYKRCSLYSIKYEEPEKTGFEFSVAYLPEFILSQIEAQKLTDIVSTKESLLPILFFITASLPRKGSEKPSFPALFRWHCKPRHRTYHFFAYLDLKMVSKTYTINQLLALRVKHTPGGLETLAKSNPDLAAIILRRKGENSGPKQVSDETQAAVKNQDDSAADEVVYKGNASRRAAAALAATPSTTPSAAPATGPATGQAVAVATAPAAAPARTVVCDMEWKYRGRSATEATANEPVSAPTGLPAQKSEGFQRFYKAVVSPTHVRVTAGGRIVPNTRGPPSPSAKRVTGDVAVDNHGPPEKLKNTKPIPGPLNLGPHGVPQYFPAFPRGYPPIPAYLPMAFGPHMHGGFPMPTAVGGPMVSQPAADGTLKTGDGQADKATEPKRTDKINLSRPDQFDQTKPFVYNGQWMFPFPSHFPPPMGNPFMPGPILGPHSLMGHPGMPPHLANPQNLGAPMMAPGAFHVPPPAHPGFSGMLPTAGPGPINKDFQPPVAPPISSIKPSDITRKQIGSFRTSLKYHEDQLQFNRHQIDEKFMENKVKAIREHIQQFEALLRTQTEHEKLYNQKREKTKEAETDPKPAPAAVQKVPDHEHRDHTSAPNHGRLENGSQHEAISATNGNSGEGAFNLNGLAAALKSIDLAKKLRLPSDAALAPPFRPRGENDMVAQSDANGSGMCLGVAGCCKPLGNSVQRPVSAGYEKWRIVSESSDQTGNSSKTWEDTVTDPLSTSLAAEKARLGVPYLVGTLPKGVDPRTARDADYQYPRELTEDETRSRHLYWGKAPRFVRQGLPKYDGKHFYPPSPAKETITNGSPESGPKMTQSEMDPFLSLFPAGEGKKSKALSTDDTYASAPHLRSFRSQIYGGSQEFQKALDEVNQPCGGHPPKASLAEAGADSGSASSRDRRSDNPVGVKLLHTMLRKGSTSSAISSTTAQGYLPQYVGYAAKSLSPSVDRKSVSPSEDGSPDQDLSDGGALLNPLPDKRGEKRLSHGEGSLEEQFRNVVSMDVANRGNLSTFNL